MGKNKNKNKKTKSVNGPLPSSNAVRHNPSSIPPSTLSKSHISNISTSAGGGITELDNAHLADLSNLMATASDLLAQTAAFNAAHPLPSVDASAVAAAAAAATTTDEYWASLPPHVRAFIKSAGKSFTGSDAERKAALTSIMKSMAGGELPFPFPFSRKSGAGGPGRVPGAFPDVEDWEAYAASVGIGLGVGVEGGEEYSGEDSDPDESRENEDLEGDEDDEYYAEEDEDDGDEPPELQEIDSPVTSGGGENRKRKKKKNKRKDKASSSPVSSPTHSQPHPQSMPAPRTQPQPRPQPPPQMRPQQAVDGVRTVPAVPPATFTAQRRVAPPPSSRAAGKQPMAYPTSNPAPNTNSNAAGNGRTAAKSKYSAAAATVARKNGAAANSSATAKKNQLWSTNPPEERARIKAFWLSLSESERRQLVQVEKDTVLKKMKEQQKHSCGCAVCGRKRHAIELELETLYDAYYQELESYASYQQRYLASGGAKGGMPPPPPGPFPGSVEFNPDGSISYHHPTTGSIVRTGPDGKHHATAPINRRSRNGVADAGSEFEEDEEEEDEEDEEESEEEIERRRPAKNGRAAAPASNATAKEGKTDVFSFGSNLTAAGPGNILTVADDLLKNDGQKFLEMMESLAERRMAREDRAAMAVEADSDEEDDEDVEEEEGEEDEEGEEEEEEEEEEGDEDDDEEEEEEEEAEEEEEEEMTDEQRKEEGKRMFSIFAARMFEQRVLQAYREKVAQERQMQLLRELEDESKAEKEKEEKKAKESAKKKEKKRLQKQARDEEKAKREAERAAEEAAVREKQEAMEEEQRKKREEERIRREAQREVQRKTQEEERARKEEEKRKRAEAERERQAELEKKKREKEEQKKEREEKERKAREEKAKAQAAAKKEREEREKEEKERKDKEEKAEREAKEKLAKEQAAQKEKERAANKQAARGTSSKTPSLNSITVASGSGSKNGVLPAPPSTPAPKKILTKPSGQSVPQPIIPVGLRSQNPTPIDVKPQLPVSTPRSATMPMVLSSQPFQPGMVTPQTPITSTPMTMSPYQGTNGLLPTMSPRAANSFPHPHPTGMFNIGAPGNPFPPPMASAMVPPALAPSALPRGFGTAPGYDPNFPSRPHLPPAIAPPGKLAGASPLPTPASPNATFANASIAPGAHMRRASLNEGFGPVHRPPANIAPIARPTLGTAPEEPASTASGSSSRRSNSPVLKNEEVLGSSALRADDDDIIVPSGSGRRIGVAPGSVVEPPPPVPTAIGVGAFPPSPWAANAPQPQGFPIRPPSAPTWAPGPIPPSQSWNPAFQSWYRPHEQSPPQPHAGS